MRTYEIIMEGTIEAQNVTSALKKVKKLMKKKTGINFNEASIRREKEKKVVKNADTK